MSRYGRSGGAWCLALGIGYALAAGIPLRAAPETRGEFPKSLRMGAYPSQELFLRHAARFELERLLGQTWSHTNEEAFFSRPQEKVTIAGDVALQFTRIPGGHYEDGVSRKERELILGVKNRNGDVARWAGMYDPRPPRRVTVPYDFYMSDTPITNAMFAAFVRATGYRTSVSRYRTGWIVEQDGRWVQGFASDWDLQVPPQSAPNHPVVQISWFDAMEFAAWLSRRVGVILRVPSKEEWLLAARPERMEDQLCLFPWGNSLAGVEKRANFGSSELRKLPWIYDQYADGYALSSPVMAFPADSRGLHDMVGNVWSWNWTNSSQYDQRSKASYLAVPKPLAELDVGSNSVMSMTGGCFLARLTHLTLVAKMGHPALDGAEDIGFRLVVVRYAESGLTGMTGSK